MSVLTWHNDVGCFCSEAAVTEFATPEAMFDKSSGGVESGRLMPTFRTFVSLFAGKITISSIALALLMISSEWLVPARNHIYIEKKPTKLI